MVTVFMLGFGFKVQAQSISPSPGWKIHQTAIPYPEMITRVKAAVKANGMGVVTQAGPTRAAKSRGITIPGNRVIGVFNNAFAVRILKLSTAAMIEAPIRFYITQEPDGGSLLSYKTPTLVFSPYMAAAGPDLAKAAQELDEIFDTIATQAIDG